MSWIRLVEIDGYTAASTYETHRFSAGRYCTWTSDTPANALYRDRVIDPGSFVLKLNDGARNNPRPEVSYGMVVLNNKDGALDTLFGSGTVSFRERRIRVLMVRKGAAYSTAVVLLDAVIAQAPELSDGEVLISIKDAGYLLANAHITATYLGNNVLPAGVEGGDDLKAKRKPVLYGRALQIEPHLVNTSKLIYQISTRPLQSVDGAYVGRKALTAGAAYTDQADMEANAPAAGTYRVWLAGGMVRLGSSPGWAFTVDATADSAANSTAAQLIKRLALDKGWDAGAINSADVSTLDTQNSAVCGLWWDDDRSTLDVMQLLANSVGAVQWFDRLGQLRMARLDLPPSSGEMLDAVAEWSAAKVTQVMDGQDVPVETVRIRYARYGRAYGRSELAPLPQITDADAADAGQEWRVATYTAAPSPNPHRRLLTTERDTALLLKSAAEAEAQRLHGLTAAPRRTHLCQRVRLRPEKAQELDLNKVVGLRWGRYGFDRINASPRRVVGLQLAFRNLSCELTLWGA